MTSPELKLRAINLSAEVATPFYLFDLNRVFQAYRELQDAWRNRFPRAVIAYSFKTNPLPAITKRLATLGAGAEVVSGTELEWAELDGFSPERIFFDGPVKRREELETAARLGARIQIDSADEARLLAAVCRESGHRPGVACRLAVPYENRISRFGMSPEEFSVAQDILEKDRIPLSGLHFHLGSNLNSPAEYARAVNRCLPSLVPLLERHGRRAWLDIGGGFSANSAFDGVQCTPDQEFVDSIWIALRNGGITPDTLRVVVEPGRRLVEDHCLLVSRVAVRKQRGETRVLVLDAGTNLARSVGTWHHPIEFARKTTPSASVRYDLYGALCFESDRFASGVSAPCDVAVGEVVLIGSVGGYDMANASVWTRPRPPVLGLIDGKVRTLRRRETGAEMRQLESTEAIA